MVKRICICGVPKSGTKLLNHMIHTALPDWDYTPEERNCLSNLNKDFVITKKPLDLFRFRNISNREDTAAIITCRDPFLVMTSKHRTKNYWVFGDRIGKGQPSPVAWYSLILKWKNNGAFIVFYEDLINNPELVQEQMGKRFNIEWKKSFLDYINNPMPKGYEDFNFINRPLSGRKLRADDLPHLGKELDKDRRLIEIRRQLGYESISVLQ